MKLRCPVCGAEVVMHELPEGRFWLHCFDPLHKDHEFFTSSCDTPDEAIELFRKIQERKTSNKEDQP